MNIQTDRYNASYDFSSGTYHLDPKKALVLHGQKYYADQSNLAYWQKIYTRYLKQTGQKKRIVPQKVNTLAKLNDIINEGFSIFEADIWVQAESDAILYLGENKRHLGLELERFLQKIQHYQTDKILFSIHHVTNTSIHDILKKLKSLDKQYHLKHKVFLRTDHLQLLTQLKQQGWYVAYDIHDQQLTKSIKKNDMATMESIAQKFALDVNKLQLKDLSFKKDLYPWVKKYLEPKLTSITYYHVSSFVPLYEYGFESKIKNDEAYMDPKVKTLTSQYYSEFEL
jgi:hypothetical protein